MQRDARLVVVVLLHHGGKPANFQFTTDHLLADLTADGEVVTVHPYRDQLLDAEVPELYLVQRVDAGEANLADFASQAVVAESQESAPKTVHVDTFGTGVDPHTLLARNIADRQMPDFVSV